MEAQIIANLIEHEMTIREATARKSNYSKSQIEDRVEMELEITNRRNNEALTQTISFLESLGKKQIVKVLKEIQSDHANHKMP